MTIEDAILIAKAKKLRVANLYEGTDGRWRCALYRKPDQSPTKWLSGSGVGPADAIRAAMSAPIELPVKATITDQFEDILG